MCASNPDAALLTHGQSVSRRLARTQRHARLLRGESPLVEFAGIEDKLGKLLQEFGPSGSEKTRHNPPTFTFLASDDRRRLATCRAGRNHLPPCRCHADYRLLYWRPKAARCK